jgi:hypothetical protein
MPLDVPVISTDRVSEIPIRHLYDDRGSRWPVWFTSETV